MAASIFYHCRHVVGCSGVVLASLCFSVLSPPVTARLREGVVRYVFVIAWESVKVDRPVISRFWSSFLPFYLFCCFSI